MEPGLTKTDLVFLFYGGKGHAKTEEEVDGINAGEMRSMWKRIQEE